MQETVLTSGCYHCGTRVTDPVYIIDEKAFCCIGCQSVYQVLSENNLCSYYSYNPAPGQAQKHGDQHFDYLDEPEVARQLVDYTDETLTVITFYIPAIHCSSCIWLLEHLHKVHPAVLHSRIDFLKKQVSVTFRNQELSLRKLVELLVSIGYEPLISLQDVVREKKNSVNRDLIKKIAVAGLCMGNVMLFSFPEYLGLSGLESRYQELFGWLNLTFIVPATFYSARDFFVSAWGGLKNRLINLDAPLALIIAVLFLRSAYEIVTHTGPGFSDTLTGLIFLLLMGRWVKQRTYYHLSFDRDYRSYFPVAVTVLRRNRERSVPINEIAVGDRMFIRNNEIIPADAILMKGAGYFDFSFVTGESEPVRKVLGEIVYAGGRQVGQAVELEVVKPVSQSYLTRLWNNETFKVRENRMQNFNDSIARYFSLVTFIIAFAATGFWMYAGDHGKAWSAFTAVLIVACPCVLALSTPFTLSAILGLFDRNRFYLKNTDVVEQLARVDTIVFDKTGTITSPDAVDLSFTGVLSADEKDLVASLARNSSHPLSRKIIQWLKADAFRSVRNFRELAGKGLSGLVGCHEVRMGSDAFVVPPAGRTGNSATVHLEIDGAYRGCFRVRQQWRPGLKQLFGNLGGTMDLHLISGDQERDRQSLETFFPVPAQMRFRQSPHDKLEYVRDLQEGGRQVMMFGDGLNDAGALKQSDLGVAVTDNINNFSPGCDAILDGAALGKLPRFIAQAKDGMRTIRMSFVISGSYNLVGIWFAVQGTLSPLTAAVLMPLSTVTIIIFTTLCTRYFARKNKLRGHDES